MSSMHGLMISIEKRMSTMQKIRMLIILLTPKLRIEIIDVDAITIGVWADSIHVRYTTITMLSVR
jgi:hypothetical protein